MKGFTDNRDPLLREMEEKNVKLVIYERASSRRRESCSPKDLVFKVDEDILTLKYIPERIGSIKI